LIEELAILLLGDNTQLLLLTLLFFQAVLAEETDRIDGPQKHLSFPTNTIALSW
jgi:hypothetical protein